MKADGVDRQVDPSTYEAQKAPHLWIVSELYYPELTSTGYYLTKIAEGLASDRPVSVICGQPNYAARGIKAPDLEMHNDVKIHRVAGTRFDRRRLPLRMLNIFTLSANVLLTELRRFRKGERILVVTTPPTLPFVTAAAALAKGCSFTLIVHDSYPEMLVATGMSRQNSIGVRLFHRFNQWLYKHASAIVVVGRDMKEAFERKTKGLDLRIEYIPNWAELESVEPRPKREIDMLSEIGISDKFVLLYAGNMGLPNDVETIVLAAERLSGDEGIHFVFVGDGAKRSWIEGSIAERRLKNVTMLGPKPRSEQVEFLNACDVGIVSLIPEMKGVSMPSRTYNLLAAGKPILAIAEPGSEVHRVLEDHNVGWLSRPGDVEGLVKTIKQIRDERSLDGMPKRAREAAETIYHEDRAIESYRRLLS